MVVNVSVGPAKALVVAVVMHVAGVPPNTARSVAWPPALVVNNPKSNTSQLQDDDHDSNAPATGLP